MATTSAFLLPEVPVPHRNFVSYIQQEHKEAVQELVAPYNAYEGRLREGFAQHRDHPALEDPNVNAVPVFGSDNEVLRVNARKTDDQAVNSKFIMPLDGKTRKLDGAPATVGSISDFKKNFNIFSESSLTDLDWSNVVAAGSSVVTALLPVPVEYNTSKKALREHYHQRLAPSSDVDLFIWGLDEAAALEKIKQIEWSVRNAILEEVTTVRTKNAITIASHYPIRHVQIVLRLYKSVSEILTGFDVDCSCFAYDGNQVYGTPRAITAFMTQTNTIDLSRRSPSYESRLSKYAHRGFEIYCPELDRSKIDPTIFERSFTRTTGLARLLVLEQLPKPSDREKYLDERREERGRPSSGNKYWNRGNALPNNIKDQDPDDIAEWVYDDEVSNYHSFTVPYGPKYHAKKIEKLLYTKDLLLNAEWNRNKDRTVDLHRHPCFIGPVESVMHDCCGSCPKPKTDDEREIAEDENKIFVFGDVAFMKDDPGRQAIGSFNPLTDDDWTDMAYIGNTQELCQKICDQDLSFVQDWCGKNPESINRRDHTGRTPLHVAAQCSTPEILKCLVDHGARIVARLVDGMTALHIVAARGSVDMVTTLLERSEANEAEEAEKEEKKKIAAKQGKVPSETEQLGGHKSDDDEDSDVAMDDASSDEDTQMTEGSFVRVGEKKPEDEDSLDGADNADPDVYDVDVVAWDTPVSALHLAILGVHVEVIKQLVSTFGADVLLPVKIVDSYSRNPRSAIMTLILAAQITGSSSVDVTKVLLSLGASSAQGDMQQVTSFHYLVAERRVELLKVCLEDDGAAARTVLNHLVLENAYWQPKANTPLTTAIRSGDSDLVGTLLGFGAKTAIDLDDFAAAYSQSQESSTSYWRSRAESDAYEVWRKKIQQPVFLALEYDIPESVIWMLDTGVDVNTVDTKAYETIASFKDGIDYTVKGGSLLDTVEARISYWDSSSIGHRAKLAKPIDLHDDEAYLEGTASTSYEHWYRSKTIEVAKNAIKEWHLARESKLEEEENKPGLPQKINALRALQQRFVELRDQLLKRGAKTLKELHPEIYKRKRDKQGRDASDESSDEDTEEKKNHNSAFDPKVTFRLSASDRFQAGYLLLFEAAWTGDITHIKKLTLAKWGPDQANSPLLVTTEDSKGFTPFAIAMKRHHFEAAKIILDIANAQFKGDDESPRRRYTVDAEESEYSSDGSEDELGISSQIVDETFTFDNIAALRQSIGSKTSPSDMLKKNAETWCLLDLPENKALREIGSRTHNVSSSIKDGRTSAAVMQSILKHKGQYTTHLGRYALVSRDIQLFRFWLHCCQEASKWESGSKNSSWSGFDELDLDFARRHGFVEEMSEMIKIAGAELPLDELVKQSGVQEEEKPKYYQGLTIGGQKMKKWARERGGSSYWYAMGQSTPPLLQAAYQGGLAAVEWFLSDTPFRLYKEYVANNANDRRLKLLAKAHGGLDHAISSWLKQRSNLSLHAAVLSKSPKSDSLSVLNYLLSIFPTSIDQPSASTLLTPLTLSFNKGRTDTASALINAGANQTTRDATSKNLIHHALVHLSSLSSKEDLADKFRSLLSLIDRRLLPTMFVERCRYGPEGLTPLAYWLASIGNRYYYWQPRLVPEVLSVMLEFGGARSLTIMDGSGQFPLHQAVKHSYAGLVKVMLEHDPALLTRENAMGQTPLELAESLYVRECTSKNPDIWREGYRRLESRNCEEFVDDVEEDEEAKDKEDNDVRATWKVCKEYAIREPRPRRLISVNEAREVARRLAERNKEKNKESGKEKEEEKKKDEVDGWLSYGALEMNR